ncbi:unnamed protein product [[Candida] boidinii]|uniref:Protein HGH1 homolog n=1 Tax=Candida boidinii TaxID=5477 RepID=A0A9W6SZW3_CANBO|nr:hypothetical protein B5S30_g4950 [[Candida] boidinii]GME71287.1 unnamed protein product [[Candida] boidinii]
MPSELEELVEFLHSPSPAISEIALANLVGYSQSSHPDRKVFAYDNYRSIADLKELSKESKLTIQQDSLTILSNLCDDDHIRNLIVSDDEYLQHVLNGLVHLENKVSDLLCILLTNIAKNDKIIKIFDMKIDSKLIKDSKVFKSDSAIDCLLDLFVKGYERKLNKYANYDYLAYFFADISRFPKGRHYFVNEQEFDNVIPISKLLVFTEKYDSKTRREGVASTIKNSLFDTDRHETLLDESTINLLPYILLPLSLPSNKGLDDEEILELPEELQFLPEDKIREPLVGIIAIYLESLLLLCVTRPIREYLRSKSVYPIIRELHKECSSDDLVEELCDRLVQMLMRDEAPSNAEIEAMHSDDETDEDEDKIMEIV